MENGKILHCFAGFHSDYWKSRFEINFFRFYWMTDLGVDHLIFHFRIVVLIYEVQSGKEVLISCGGISRGPVISVVLNSSLETLASDPLFWSMARSSFFVVVLSKLFYQQFFRFGLSQFFVSYLVAAPPWGMSVSAAEVANSCCTLSSSLVWFYCSKISFYSINPGFLLFQS